MYMQQHTIRSIIIGTLVGLVIGWLIWGGSTTLQQYDMSTAMHDMNAGLVGKDGDVFDQSFITEMITHHEGAVAMAQLALMHAKHQEIKDLAQAIITAQTTEIQQMKSWQQEWYGR